ncbi:PAS domain-containing protein [Salinilacihabitans rarus]|uniref:sensor histidine kinase n=1 Tax=Salinilacihabitans rarus TaxID=2961596 RepID=UPI0020C8C52D|nr:PAS domain-containing protein [Salinilacihabitans rarus]
MIRRSIPVVDRVGDPFFALDTDFRFTYLNGRAEALLDRPRGELIGRVMWDEFPETVETQFPDGFYRAMDEQVPVSFEVYHTPLETWFEARAFPAENGLSVYMRDVTERKQRRIELARHAAVVEAVNDGVVTLDRNSRIVSLNDAIRSVLELDGEDVVGEHVETLIDRASIGAADAVEIGRAINEVEIGNATYRKLEIPFVDAEGTERVGELRVVPIDYGKATVAGVARDVTERHEYERVVTSLHEITRWLLGSDDPEEICAIAVHAGSDLLGLPISGVWLLDDERGALEPVAGTAGAYEEFGGLPRFTSGDSLVWNVFEAGEIERYDDLHAVDGAYNPGTPIRSEIIAPIGTHGVLMTGSLEPHEFDETDVDLVSTLVENTRAALDRAARERVLRERTRELERQTDRLEVVAEILSTDLAEQLDAVAAALEDDGSDDEWEFPFAEDDVESTLDRTERLLDDVREFARNATAVGLRSRIDLESAIEEAVAASRLENPRIVVEESATLRADPDRFARLLESILDDAAARADGTVTIQVGLLGFEEPVDGSRGFFLLDDAAEIPPTDRERVLDPAAATDDAADGFGLGLGLARAIADAHDWTLSVAGGDRGGTRIEIRDVTTLERR